MIIRLFRGVVVPRRDAAFYGLVRERVAAFRATHAMIESHIGRRTTPEGDHFLITTHWPDWDALHRWAGDDLGRPWGFDELLPFLQTWEVEHYEEIDQDDA
jgi:hypothetical protein